MKTESDNTHETVLSHPDRIGFTVLSVVVALMFAAYSLAWHFSAKPLFNPDLMLWADMVIWFLICGCLGFIGWVWTVTLRADGFGLHWRTGCVRWQDIVDFYEIRPRDRATQKAFAVESRTGKKIHFTSNWKNHHELCDAIAARAANTKTSCWGLKGGRPVDEWPRTLTYNTRENQIAFWVTVGLCGLQMLYVVVILALKLQKLIADVGIVLALAYAGMYVLVMASLPVIGYIAMSGLYIEARRRQNQHIIVSRDGIVFTDGEKRVAALWNEVTDFYLLRSRWQLVPMNVVETANGTFDFSQSLKDAPAVCAMIATCVPEKREWRIRDERENLVNLVSPVGTHIYHYRTRTNRAMLWLLTFLVVCVPLGFWAQGVLGATVNHPENGWWISLFIGLPTVWLWWGYFSNRVEVTAEGITQHSPFGRRHVRWQEVTAYPKQVGKGDEPVQTISDGKTRLRFWGVISDPDKLQEDIQQYVCRGDRR